MFKDNNFTRNTHEEHLQRCQLCALGVATYDAELAFRPSWVSDITAHAPAFEALLNEQNIQDAEWHGAVESLETARNNLYELNSSARWMVKTILDDPTMESGVLRLIDDAFDIDEKLSKGFFNLTENTRKLLNGQAKLVAMTAPWTLPAAMVTNLTDGLAAVESLADAAEDEHGEKLKATDDIYTARSDGEHLLRNIFRWVVANWGDDDPRMLEFGFVPKSSIWTPGDPEPGEPEEQLPEIPDKPEGVYANFMTEPVTAMLVGCGKYGEHTGFDVVRAVTPAGVTETPTRPEELFATNIDVINEPLLDTDIDPGYRYWYWVRARNGDEVGEWSEVVWVEYL